VRLTDGAVVVRETHERDFEGVRVESADPETKRWLNVPADPDAAAREYLDWARTPDPARLCLTIADPATDEYLGALIVFLTPRTQIAEVGYGITPAARGRGVAGQAVSLVARWLFAERGVRRVELRTHPDNAASIRVAEKAGFVREGIERSSREINGTRYDVVCFSLLPDDLPS
jgi:RimJ/RimL family protein N-acetyltransferase